MIRLHVLGPIALHGSDDRPLSDVLHRPKRLALLAYMAVAPAAFYRRDTLLGLFWPELDQDHARGALSQALYVLRRALGRQVLLNRGIEEVGTDRTLLWCDAFAFTQLVQQDRLEEALELYRGPLLDGVYLSDAEGFEHWLDQERARLVRLAAQAALTLSERAEARDDRIQAVHWARRVVDLDPTDEQGLRRLLVALESAGDRSAAVHAYDQFQQRLRDEYDVEPAAETRAFINALRADQLTGTQLTTSPVAPPPLPGVPAGGAEGPPTAVARPSLPPDDVGDDEPPVLGQDGHHAGGTRQRMALALALSVVLAAGVGAVIGLWPGTGSAPDSSPERILVLPFSVQGRDDTHFLGEAMVTLLSAGLDGAGALRSIDPRAVLSATRSGRWDGDLAAARALAVKTGAASFVRGDITEVDGHLRVVARVYEIHADSALVAQEITVEGVDRDVFGLADALTVALLGGRSREPHERLARVAALTTRSVPALKAYLEGEGHLLAGRFAEGVDPLQRAVDADSTFALAYYRLSTAATWSGRDSLARASSMAAVRLSDRLTYRDRLLVEAWHEYLFGAAEQAESYYLNILASYPSDLEAWHNLGELRFHWKPSVGVPAAQARSAFERVLALAPEHAGAMLHLARMAASDGRGETLDSLLSRLDGTSGSQRLETLALRAFALGDQAALSQLDDEAADAGAAAIHAAARTAAVHAGSLVGAERLSRHLVSPRNAALQRATGHVLRAHLAMAMARPDAAERELMALDGLQPGWAAEHRAILLCQPLVSFPDTTLRAARRALSEAPTYVERPRFTHPTQVRPVQEPRRRYLLARLALLAGDEGVETQIVALENFNGPSQVRAQARDMARLLRAEMEWRRDRPRAALGILGTPRLDRIMLPELNSAERAHERWLRAELLHALGEYDEALRWYATFPDPQGYDLAYLAPSHLRRAEIHRRRGETALASAHLTRFRDLWRRAEH